MFDREGNSVVLDGYVDRRRLRFVRDEPVLDQQPQVVARIAGRKYSDLQLTTGKSVGDGCHGKYWVVVLVTILQTAKRRSPLYLHVRSLLMVSNAAFRVR